MNRIIGIAAVQVAPVAYDVEATFRSFEQHVRQLAASVPSAVLHVFPEFYLPALGSYDEPAPSGWASAVAEPIPGPTTERVAELAREVGKWIVPGSLVERAGDALHNTTVVIGPDGELVAAYRKLFPWMPHENSVPGDRYVTFDVPRVGRFGLAICYDGWVPEISRTLAWMGAEVILQPTYTRSIDREQELVLARANAIANQLYVVNPNIGGLFGTGRSTIIDPEGRVLAQGASGEEYLSAFLDLDLVATVREHGTAGLNQLWKQLRDFPPPFPPALESYAAGEIMRDLGPLRAPAARPCAPPTRA
ncbi:nitrilase-related carbon-nitrogen hydrolase [Conexibacter arvalis]|uniref:Formamidase n=1 Tax=Conexibacter arvalis TaxID=912552 RepID=A0A840IBS0_9ACTN|nr:formamidase [Conexibacter arvalis]